jgi:hypothetical protein
MDYLYNDDYIEKSKGNPLKLKTLWVSMETDDNSFKVPHTLTLLN